MFNFYLLPLEIQDHINNMVIEMYQKEQRFAFINVLKEIECLWYWSLWGSSMLYNTNNEPIHILNHPLNSNSIINYVRQSNCIPYITPKMIKHIKNDPNYIIIN